MSLLGILVFPRAPLHIKDRNVVVTEIVLFRLNDGHKNATVS